MKIDYRRQQRRKRTLFFGVLITACITIVIGALIWFGGVRVVRMSYAYVAAIAVGANDSLTTATKAVVIPKRALVQENQALRETLLTYQALELERDALRLENSALRRVAPETDTSERVRIISTHSTLYGTLTALAAEEGKITIGDVVVFNTVALGYVDRLDGRLLTVQLYTQPGVETDVVVGAAGSAVMTGSGGYGEIRLPRSVPIEVGDVVTAPIAGGRVIGSVAEVLYSDEDAYQVVLVEVPIAIRLMQFAAVVHE